MTPSIGAFVVSRDGENRLPSVIACLRYVTDTIVVYVDARSTDNTRDVAHDLGVTVLTGIPESGIPEGAFAECVDALGTDWLLHLDDDELLGPTLIDRMQYMTRSDTAWRFPRYHVYPTYDRYISSAPYYPDYQLRLIQRKMWIEQGGWQVRVHTSPAWTCQFSSAGIFHYKFMLYTRAEREQRLEHWGANWGDALNDHYRSFSVIEGRNVQTDQIPEPLPLQSFAGVMA